MWKEISKEEFEVKIRGMEIVAGGEMFGSGNYTEYGYPYISFYRKEVKNTEKYFVWVDSK